MSETFWTRGWPSPKGNCDICRQRPATHWFGDTSVALCNEPTCRAETQDDWDRGQAEADD